MSQHLNVTRRPVGATASVSRFFDVPTGSMREVLAAGGFRCFQPFFFFSNLHFKCGGIQTIFVRSN